MKTEISRSYKSGFLLSEQELRRIAQSAQEHAQKIGANEAGKFSAKLKDGSVIETERLDDLLALENGGQKSVTKVRLQWSDRDELPKASVAVQFEDGEINEKGWDSVFSFRRWRLPRRCLRCCSRCG